MRDDGSSLLCDITSRDMSYSKTTTLQIARFSLNNIVDGRRDFSTNFSRFEEI